MIGRVQMMPPPEKLPGEILGGSENAAASAARTLLIVTSLLLVFGLTMLYSTSYGVVGSKYFRLQFLWLTMGAGSGITVYLLGYRRVASWGPVLACVVFLLLLAALCTKEVNGAHRWLQMRLPGLGKVGIQPSEFAKITLALVTAKYCSDNLRTFHQLKRWKGGLLNLCLYVVPVLLGILIGKDLGTTVLASSMVFLMLLAARLPTRWVGLPAAAAVAGFFYIMNCDPMRRARLLSFIDPEKVATKTGYQLWNSFLALGAGGWHGVGFMESRMKAHYLPESHTDFILSIVGEELGLIAMLAVVVGYTVFCWAGVRISLNANSRLGMLLGFGLTIFITLQAIINIGVICGAFPTKGMPAPFISYGGSNMLSCLTAVGLLLSIAQETVSPGYNKQILAYLRRKWPFSKDDGTNGE